MWVTSDKVQSIIELNKSQNFQFEEKYWKNGKSSNESITFNDSSFDNIEEEIREIGELTECMSEIY